MNNQRIVPLIILIGSVFLPGRASAMVFKPEKGAMWDPSVLWHNGKYYAFMMYNNDGQAMAVQLGIGQPDGRETHVGRLATGPDGTHTFSSEDVTGKGCATVTGIEDGKEHAFRLLCLFGLLDLYVDDLLVQTYIHAPGNGKVGFLVCNAQAEISDLRAWAMSFAEVKTDKTLVSWVTLASTTQQGGSALTIQNGMTFDDIVFGEKEPGKWMAGSDYFLRTQRDQRANAAETADAKTLVQMAIVYQEHQISLYRNGQLYASYAAMHHWDTWFLPLGYSLDMYHLQVEPHGSQRPGADHETVDHAVSKERIHWQKQPVALRQGPRKSDDDGCLFTGYAVEHEETIYPNYCSNHHDNGRRRQGICLATSKDGGRTSEKYAGNPMIDPDPNRYYAISRPPPPFGHHTHPHIDCRDLASVTDPTDNGWLVDAATGKTVHDRLRPIRPSGAYKLRLVVAESMVDVDVDNVLVMDYALAERGAGRVSPVSRVGAGRFVDASYRTLNAPIR